ncbi:MAG: hypothetical protein QG628_809 [Patescibacteria group bacterium]|jgi:NTP pyrophosphatase (non-canonical NTP hydrolase)|nr:hypothetical protein [Patescibacteria group bacterium]
MDIDDFQKQALDSIAIRDKNLSALAHRGFGLTGEAGRVAEIIKKVIRDKNGTADSEDIAQLQKRLGDTLYYIAVLAEYYDLDLSDIAKQNLKQSAEFKASRT